MFLDVVWDLAGRRPIVTVISVRHVPIRSNAHSIASVCSPTVVRHSMHALDTVAVDRLSPLGFPCQHPIRCDAIFAVEKQTEKERKKT